MKTTRRQEIDLIQIESLARLWRLRTTFWNRVAVRIRENFLGRPLADKIRFVKYSLKWALARVRDRILRAGRAKGRAAHGLLRVAVHGTGSMGDFLTHTMFIEQFQRAYGPITIDFFCRTNKLQEALFVLQNAKYIRSIAAIDDLAEVSDYDLIVSLKHIPKYEVMNRARLAARQPELLEAIQIANQRLAPIDYIVEAHPVLDGLLARKLGFNQMNAADALGHFGNLNVTRHSVPFFCPNIAAYDAVVAFGLENKRYVTVHDGYDPEYLLMSNRATKCWIPDHWAEFVQLLKARFPNLLVIQLGARNSGQIDGVDLNLVGRTTLDEAAWIIKSALLHIDGESGLVRMARALHITSVVMFGPTSASYFAFDRNINLVSDICHDCWWVTQDWMSFCPRGLPQPECMISILPTQVLDAADRVLTEIKPQRCKLLSRMLYDSGGLRQSREATLADIFHALDLPAVPISEHSRNSATGVYLHASKQWEYLFACDQLEPVAPCDSPRPKVLDIGGGRGALAAYLAKQNFDVELVDVDYLWDHGGDLSVEQRFIQYAGQCGLKTRYGSMFNIPAENESFDVVTSISVMEHVRYKELAFREALRVLRPGGLLIMSFDFTLNPRAQEDDLRVEIFTPERLQNLLGSVGVGEELFSPAEVDRSIAQIQLDKVLGIPSGMTVGAVALKKL